MSGLIPGKSFNQMLPRQRHAVPFPPFTDLIALLGIDLALCAAGLRLLAGSRGGSRWAGWALAAGFVLLWLPVGGAHLPVLAYVRGISSDLSMTLVALACLCVGRRLFGLPAIERRDGIALSAVIALAAALLYCTALGWGNWDAYRLGWGSFHMLGVLLALSMVFWAIGMRLLPALIALALLAWAAGLMESANLWDYLIDPWLAVGALAHCMKAGAHTLLQRHRRRALPVRPDR